MGAFLLDFRYALRVLLKRPGFTVVIVATLALGIGANTVIFSAVNGIYLKPLPYDDPEQLVVVDGTTHYPGRSDIAWHGVDYRNFIEWDAESRVFAGMGAFQRSEPTLTGKGQPERLNGARVTVGFLPMLGVAPVVGRVFHEDDARADATRVAVLAYALWQRRFGGDSNVVGTSLILDDVSHTVVGVLPAGFRFPMNIVDAEIWTLVLPHDEAFAATGRCSLSAVVRLKPGGTLGSAQGQLNLIAQRLERRYPDRNYQYTLDAVGLHERVVGNTRPLMMLLLAAVGLLLAIACANVANMLLTSGAARRRELAVRAALGADRSRLLRQLLTESVVLAVLGGLAGFWLATFGTDGLVALLPAHIPRKEEIVVDKGVFAFTLGVSVLTGLLFGLPLAVRTARQDLNTVLKEGSGVAATRGRHRLQGAFVVGQIATAIVLLVGAGLLIRSFHRVTSVELGYAPENVFTFRFDIGEVAQPQERPAYIDAIADRLASMPGVQSVGACLSVPMGGGGILSSYQVLDQSDRAANMPPFAGFNPVTENYFATMGIPVMQGRCFGRLDVLGGLGVAVIDQTFARKLWPGEVPLGKRISRKFKVTDDSPDSFEIVGIVGDVRAQGHAARPRAQIYVPYRQHPHPTVTLTLKTTAEAGNLVPAIRSELTAVSPDGAPYDIAWMEDLLASDVAPRRFPMLLLGLFAVSALVLAGVGVYGMISYSVAQRTREFGVRMAMGARSANVVRLVLFRGLKLTAIGLAIGLPVAFVLARVLSSQLYEIGVADPLTFIGVSALLSTVALVACYIPARRATRVDPIVALRCE